MTRAFAVLPAVLVAAVAACSNPEPKPSTEPAPGPTPTVQRTPIGELPAIDVDAVLAHTKALSSDLYEGRGPGTEGEELTITYLVDQFRKMGVKPGNEALRTRLEGVMDRRQAEITQILKDYGVPLLERKASPRP